LSRPKHQVHPRTNPHRTPPASHQIAKTIPQLVTQVYQRMLTAGRIATSMLAQVVEMVPHQTLSAGMGQTAAPASNLTKMGQNNALIARVTAGLADGTRSEKVKHAVSIAGNKMRQAVQEEGNGTASRYVKTSSSLILYTSASLELSYGIFLHWRAEMSLVSRISP